MVVPYAATSTLGETMSVCEAASTSGARDCDDPPDVDSKERAEPKSVRIARFSEVTRMLSYIGFEFSSGIK